MPGSLSYVVWSLASVAEVMVVVCALTNRSFRRYFALNLYMLCSLVASVLRYAILSHYGFSSAEYVYFYYYSDALLTLCLFCALITLYLHVLDELKAERFVHIAATLLLLGTALFSYMVIRQSTQKMLTHFVVEMSQNLYFVGLVLTYILWGAIMKLRETRTRLIQLVLSTGLYFSAYAALYALRNLYPSLHVVLGYFPPLIAVVLPAAWAYAFWRVPEDARLAPARLAVVPR
jgi:hypothetical protein